MTEQFANNASSTLNGAINNSTTTIVVTSATPFPTVGNFRLLIGTNPSTAEIVLVTGVSGTTFTVLRGQENTSPSSWPDLTTVTHILTAGAVEQIRTQFVTVGNELYTTKTVSIDPNATVASSHGDGYSKLYVNGDILATKFAAGEIPLTTQTFSYVSDALQAFVVPVGVTSIKVKMWGPGGGTGNYSGAGGGGPGGYSTGFLSVTPGETLYLAVGSGGKHPVSTSGNGGNGGWPGGGFGTRGDASGGGGGGFTGIFNTSMTQANALMIAGGGGGSTGFGNFSAGGGGGTTGGSGTGGSGFGGSQVAGGNGGGGSSSPPTAGTALAGGTAFTDQTTSTSNDCGGGGSGYFGGGAGQGDGRAGGGGSGFLHATRVTSGVTTTGANASSGNTVTNPPNTTDPNYSAGVGVGAAATGAAGTDGGNGYVVLQWGGITTVDLDSIDFGNTSTISTVDTNMTISPATNGTLTLSAAGASGALTLAPTSGLITLSSTSDILFSCGTSSVIFNMSAAQKFKVYSSGAVVIGGADAQNDTSAEAQASLTGPLINLSSSTGAFGTSTNQAIIFNQSGALNLQGNTEVRFNTGPTFRGYFDSGGSLRIGPSATSTSTVFTSNTIPGSNIDALYSYNSGGNSNWHVVSGNSSSRGLVGVYNTAAGTNATIAIRMQACGTTDGATQFQGNGVIEQHGASTSCLLFSKTLGDGTLRATQGRIYQSGVWAIGDATQNDTSSEAQAGLTGPLLNISQTTGGVLTTVANQALLYNVAGVVTLQGNTGHNFITGTTSIASTNANKFITSLGRRSGITTVAENITVPDGYHNIFIPTLTSSITITLPSTPTSGDTYLIKDRDGSATAFNIIISGNGKNIEQFTGAPAASLTLNQNYDSVTLIYNGTSWSII